MEPRVLGCRSEEYMKINITRGLNLVVSGCSTSPSPLVVIATSLALLLLLSLRLSWLLLLLRCCCWLVVPAVSAWCRWRRKNYSRRKHEVCGRCSWCTCRSCSRPAQSRDDAIDIESLECLRSLFIFQIGQFLIALLQKLIIHSNNFNTMYKNIH